MCVCVCVGGGGVEGEGQRSAAAAAAAACWPDGAVRRCGSARCARSSVSAKTHDTVLERGLMAARRVLLSLFTPSVPQWRCV